MKKCHSIAALMALVLLTSCMPNSEDGLKKKKESLENIKTDIDVPAIGSKPNPSIGNTPVAVDTPAAAGTPSTGNVSMPNVGVVTPPSSGSTSSNSSQIASMPQLKPKSFSVQTTDPVVLKLTTEKKGSCEYKVVSSGTQTDLLSGYSPFSSTGSVDHSATLGKRQNFAGKNDLIFIKCTLEKIAYAPFISVISVLAEGQGNAASEGKPLSLVADSLVIEQYGKSLEMKLTTPEVASCFYSIGIRDAAVPTKHYMFSRTDKGEPVGYVTTSHFATYHELNPYTPYTVYVNCKSGVTNKDYPTLTKHFFSGQTESSTNTGVVTPPTSVVTSPSSGNSNGAGSTPSNNAPSDPIKDSLSITQTSNLIKILYTTPKSGTCQYKISPNIYESDYHSGYSPFPSTGGTLHSIDLDAKKYKLGAHYKLFLVCSLGGQPTNPKSFDFTRKDGNNSLGFMIAPLSSNLIVLQQNGDSLEVKLTTPDLAICGYNVTLKGIVDSLFFDLPRFENNVPVDRAANSHLGRYRVIEANKTYSVTIRCKSGVTGENYPLLTKDFISAQITSNSGSVPPSNSASTGSSSNSTPSNNAPSVITTPIIEAKDVISNYLTVSNRKTYLASEIASAKQALIPISKKDAQGNYKYLIDLEQSLGKNPTNEAIVGWSKFFVGSAFFAAYEGTNKKNISCRYSRKNESYEDMYHAKMDNEGIQFFPTHLKVAFSAEEAQETGSLYYVKCKNFADDKIESLVIDMVAKFPSQAKTLNLNFNAKPDPLYTEAKSVNFKNLRFEKEAPAYIVSAANRKYFVSTNTQKVELSLESLENASCLYSFEDKSRSGTYSLFAMALEDKSWIPTIQKNGNKKIHYFNLDKKLADGKSTLEVPVYVICAREGQILATTYTHHIKIDFSKN